MYKTKMMRLLLLLLIVNLISCSDDFTVEDAPAAVNSGNFFNTEEDYNSALIGSYDILQSTYLNVILGEIASDNTNAGGESATDVVGWQQVDRMQHTPTNQDIDDVWDRNFAGVQRASFIIQNKDKTEFDGKAQIIAEARFLRAYFNFELVKWFGAIPIKPDGGFELGDETSLPRTQVDGEDGVYAYIEDDLKKAIADLAVQPPQTGRASKASAQALLGKVFLYQEKFQQSAEQLNEVINSGQFHLFGTQEDENFLQLFEFANENSPESVFEIQYTNTEGAGFGCLVCVEGNVAVGFSGVRGYAGPIYESGFGFNLPRQEVVDAFNNDDLRKQLSILDIEAWAADTDAEFQIGNQDEVTGHTGYYNRKYIPRENERESDPNLTHPNNYRAIRYADVLLMAAEALNRGGINDDLARNYVNQIRERAGLNTVNSSGSQLLDDIYLQRRLELVGEGHRFFDLVRTDRAAQEIEGFQAPKHNLFPVPLEEIQFSQGTWEQNPDY